MELKEKLIEVQTELKAPKGQYNNFGGFSYRSCEDILEAVKPLLKKYKCTLTISDEIEEHCGLAYVRATAIIRDAECEGMIANSAYARESLEKKGMDASQLTGTASSYARKYALNGLFLIDDTKDADTDEHNKVTGAEKKEEKKATPKQIELLRKLAEEQGKTLDEETVKNWSMQYASDVISKYKGVK